MRRFVRLSGLMLLLVLAVAVLLLSASVYTFHVLTNETLIAELSFEQTGEQRYLAHLRTGDLCEERTFPLYGDQWRLDAEFLKWKYWALLLGLDSQYRLERIEGRYRAVGDQNAKPTQSHALVAETALDISAVARVLGPVNFLTDATYGSSTYHDIDPGRTYLVYKSPTGIFTRAAALPPARRGEPSLAVEVRAGCGGGPGFFERVAGWTDTAALAVLGGGDAG
jgi:hypothetical protein